MSGATSSRSYEVVVEGVLDERWTGWFDGHQLTYVDGHTVIGPVLDESALHAVLARVRDLGLALLVVRRVDPGGAS